MIRNKNNLEPTYIYNEEGKPVKIINFLSKENTGALVPYELIQRIMITYSNSRFLINDIIMDLNSCHTLDALEKKLESTLENIKFIKLLKENKKSSTNK